ncbi:MAG: hydroxyacid dehydrogenase [Bacteroidales bacterium]|nr:hydroxyacid dehydrogenase [Bacteroidales bacterium]
MDKVVLSEDINPQGKALLAGKAELIIAPDTSEETAIELLRDAAGLILRATTQINARVLEHAQKLKVIARTGVGLDNVDIEAANKKGIYVCNFPGLNNLTVAEHTIAMIMALSKQVIHMHQSVKSGNWNERFSTNQIEVADKKLGIIGMGQIGQLVAKKCSSGLGMNIIAYDPYVKDKFSNQPYTFTDNLEELFRSSDFITLHVPNLPETRGLVSKKFLGLMKKTAFIINTSRGAVIDEPALIEALQNRRIKGAALDVFLQEPLNVNYPFNSLDNVILSPHCAGSTWESNVRIAISAAQAVLDVLEGKVPDSIYNKNLLMNENRQP